MSFLKIKNCLKGIVVLSFMLFFHVLNAQNNFTEVDNWMKDNLNEIGGRAVVLIYKDGKIIYSNSLNNLSEKQKRIGKLLAKRRGTEYNPKDFTPDTRLRIASSSKWLTAALVMTFVDEGKLNLNDSIGKYLPIFTKYGKGSIKVWHCLSHLTGIYQASLQESLKEINSFNNMNEAMNFLAQQPIEGEAGKTFHYGNVGLQIAAAIIEKIAGENFEKLFAERIAKPLQMKQTDFGNKSFVLAAGGAFSTTNEYMNFLIMILNKGVFQGKRILSENAVFEMQKNRIANATIQYSPAKDKNFGYGFGEWIEKENNNFSEVVSSPGILGSLPLVDNKRKYCAFLMTENLNYNGRQERNALLIKAINKAINQE